MRTGGLSTAKRAGVPKALRCQQSGHQSNAHKVYESDDDTLTEGNLDLPKNEPPGGFRKRASVPFFANVRSVTAQLPAKTASDVKRVDEWVDQIR